MESVGEQTMVSLIKGKICYIGEQAISAPPEKEIHLYIEAQFAILYDLCDRYKIPIPTPPVTPPPEIEISAKPLTAYAQRRAERDERRREREKKKNQDRTKAGWITRRGVERIMAEIPGIQKSMARELYLTDYPRTRADIPTSETAKTPSQKAWVTRIQNVIDEAKSDNQALTWAEAHKIVLSRFHGSHRHARSG